MARDLIDVHVFSGGSIATARFEIHRTYSNHDDYIYWKAAGRAMEDVSVGEDTKYDGTGTATCLITGRVRQEKTIAEAQASADELEAKLRAKAVELQALDDNLRLLGFTRDAKK